MKLAIVISSPRETRFGVNVIYTGRIYRARVEPTSREVERIPASPPPPRPSQNNDYTHGGRFVRLSRISAVRASRRLRRSVYLYFHGVKFFLH